MEADFKADGIVFAGVGKADWEIRLALQTGIGAFNVESPEELEALLGLRFLRCAPCGEARHVFTHVGRAAAHSTSQLAH